MITTINSQVGITKYILLSLFLVFSVKLFSQQSSKQHLSIDDFKNWNVLTNGNISYNGEYVSYEVAPQKGDGKLIIFNKNTSDTIPRGYSSTFGTESNFVVFKIKPHEAELRKAKLDKTKKENMPQDSLGIFVFENRRIFKFEKLKSYKLPEENSKWIAFTIGSEKDTIRKEGEPKNREENNGNDLVLFEASSGDTISIKNVTGYYFSKYGDAIYYVMQNEDSVQTTSTVFRFDADSGTTKEIFSSPGWIKHITSDEEGEKVAFLMSQDTIKEKVYSLYLGSDIDEPSKIVDKYTRGIPVGWSPSENGQLFFSQDGTKLYLGVAEPPVPEQKDSLLAEEKPKLDIWNWKDDKLQPQQNAELEKEKKRTYLGVYHVDLKRYVQLADVNVKQVSTIQKGNGNVALGTDDSPYLRSSSWTGKNVRDYYLIDVESGLNRLVLTAKTWVRLSPHGKHILWYEQADSSYYSMSTNINTPEKISLTKILPVAFYNEWHDTPSEPSPYGIAGWSQDDRFVYIYDRYDIWKFDPSGIRVPVNVTKAFGRRNSTRLRYVKLDKDLEYIPLTEPVLLNAHDERTMAQGYFSIELNTNREIKYVIMENYIFSNLKKARKAEKLIYTKEDVKTYPDLWVSNLEFKHANKLSEANPQQDKYNWVTTELVSWNSFSGEKLNGILYKPENFNPSRKYPLLVYFYERSSETLNHHYVPSPSRSTINKTFYASNGYLVFVPDITYEIGYPGQSAYNAVVSGTQYLIQEYDFVDENNIGLQGQSWGGYQTAYIITQTDMFAAAMAGAPVSNMTSAYGGIRWESGRSRMFQYEHTQSRIGGTLWEKPLLYIENSPLFDAPRINTPLLMMHNDNDGAVPWYQGIELFVAMRRLDKPAWLLTYNGEPHNLRASSWANRIDLSTRMYQFFNHYLKFDPMPEWMDKGIPAIDKGEELGY